MFKLHDQHVVVLDRGDYTSCAINLHGATVTSWRIRNQELIFVSRMSKFTQWFHVSGGIQLVFPAWGQWTFGPNNGFARMVKWKVEEGPSKLETGDVYVVLTLTDDPYTRSLWNYQFKLYYKITLCQKKLTFKIGVENPSQYSCLEFFILQYCMIRVPHVSECQLLGFQNYWYMDFDMNDRIFKDTNETITISEHMNRVYYKCPRVVSVQNIIAGGSLRLETKQTKDINVWNPWIEQCEKLSNMEDDEYQYFIAVQAGIVSKHVRLEPWCCWAAFQSFEFIPRPEKTTGEAPKHFYDYFDGYC